MASSLLRGPLKDPQRWQGRDVSRTTPQQLLSRVMGAFATSIVRSWLFHWIRSSIGNILPTRLGQIIALVLAFWDTLDFIKSLDVYQTRTLCDNIASAAFIMVPMMSVLLSKGTLLPFCGLLRSSFLINGQFMSRLLPSLAFYIDQQTADVASLTDIGLAILRVLLFVAPGSTLIALVAITVSAWALTFISIRIVYSQTWSRLMKTTPLQVAFINSKQCQRILDRSLERAREYVDNWQFVRAQKSIAHLPPLCHSHLRNREIRLLEILRKRPFQAPRFRMFTVSVDEAPPYEAVSHAWTYPVEFVHVCVNGSFQMQVPRRLYHYLCHRQSFFNSKRIWVDAICIDQDDRDEKARQVKLMRDVFGNALQVIVWLASPAEVEDATLVRNYLWWTRLVHSFAPSMWLFQAATNMSSRTERAILRILGQRWFQRVWMVQEIALAKRILILYGSVCFEWWEIDSFVGLMVDSRYSPIDGQLLTPGKGDIVPEHLRSVANILHMSRLRHHVQNDRTQMKLPPQLRRKDYKMLSFEVTLQLTIGFFATDHRDRFFALLGTVNNPQATLPEPDYQSSFNELYLKTAALLLTSGQSPSVSLNFAGIGLLKDSLMSSLQPLPSWAPDYLSYVGLTGQVIRTIDPDRQVNMTICENYRELRVQIIQIDDIARIGPVGKHLVSFDKWNPNQESTNTNMWEIVLWVLSTKSFAITDAKSRRDDPESASRLHDDSFWRTLFADQYANESPMSPELLASMGNVEKMCEKIVKGGKSLLNSLDDPDGVLLVMCRSLGENTLGRRFAISRRGKYILAPPLAQERDVVGMFQGYSEPFLFRRTVGDCWQLVGACYFDNFEILRRESSAVFETITIV